MRVLTQPGIILLYFFKYFNSAAKHIYFIDAVVYHRRAKTTASPWQREVINLRNRYSPTICS